MKLFPGIIIFFIFILWSCTVSGQNAPIRHAEGLWEEHIPFDSLILNTTLTVVPFSSSNCGYCLIDGYFTEMNYITANERNGGTGLHQCLFNPQIDIFAFQKHFGWHTPILTWPPDLYRYHEDGFPTVLAFRNGKQVLRNFYNYDKFDTLKSLLQMPDTKMTPTGNLHLATRFIYENSRLNAIVVIPAGTIPDARLRRNGIKWNAYIVKPMDSLTPGDLNRHLMLKGNFPIAELQKFFSGRNIPVKFENGMVEFGEYGFPFDSVGMQACFPNPFYPEKFMVIDLTNGNKLTEEVNYLDFVVYHGQDSNSFKKIFYGHFDKSDPHKWKTDTERTFSEISLHSYCIRQCDIPRKKIFPITLGDDVKIECSGKKSPCGTLFTLGNKNCRFPAITAGLSGGPAVVWEEDGNILLCRISDKGNDIKVVEGTAADAYSPVVAAEGNRTWVFWLGKKDGYYRVYGRFLEENRWSDEILISRKEAFDAVSLATASDGEEITVAWSEWRANQRFLRTIAIHQGVLAEEKGVFVAPPQYIDDYYNAWYASLSYIGKGNLWGAWNQHYPGTLCVVAGNLTGPALPVTAQAKNMDDWEIGGYPDIFSDRTGNLYTVWQSNGWDVYWDSIPQHIRISGYNSGLKKWLPGVDLPLAATTLNETPKAVCGTDGTFYVVWSGRANGETSEWGIWLTKKKDGEWTQPIKISPDGLHTRHPDIVIQQDDGSVWISWHSGSGDSMKVQLLKLE